MERQPIPPAQERLLAWLAAEAAARHTCPTNAAIAERFGYGNPSGGGAMLDKLEELGRISIERGYRWRVVTIVETGAQTARPAGAPPPAADRLPPTVISADSRPRAAAGAETPEERFLRVAREVKARAAPALAEATAPAPITEPEPEAPAPTSIEAPPPVPALPAAPEPQSDTTPAPETALTEEVSPMSNAQPVANTVTALDFVTEGAPTGTPLLAVPKRSPAADAMRGVSEDLWSRRTAIIDHIETLEIQAATLMEAAIEVEWTAHLLEQAA